MDSSPVRFDRPAEFIRTGGKRMLRSGALFAVAWLPALWGGASRALEAHMSLSWPSRNPPFAQSIAVREPMQTFGERAVRKFAWVVSVSSNGMEMLRARLDRHHKQMSRCSVVLLSKWHIARQCFETKNETFWLVAPGIGVTMLMATIVFLIGR